MSKNEMKKLKCECCKKDIEGMGSQKYCYNCGKYVADLKIKVTETEDSVILDIEEIELEEIEPKKTQKRKLNAKGGKK